MAISKRYVELVLASLLVLTAIANVSCWKKEEFRNCRQTPFCKQGRARKPHTSHLKAVDVSLQDGALTARLESTISDDQNNVPPALILEISVYQDGILRFKVDEEAAEDKRKRFQVPDVLVEDVENKKLWLQRVNQEKKDGVLSSVFYLAPGYEGVLQHDPFEVYVRKGKERLISFNSKGLFHFEQLRQKNEEENWEESFRSHTDSRPHGPQAVSLDVSFHGAKFVYGIPEHAAGLALKPTRGPKVESEPYRLFNLDVFEYLPDSPFGIYGSIPFMTSHSKESTTGFFWLNAAEMQIDVMTSGWDEDHSGAAIDTHWMSESGIVDGFFFLGPDPKDVVRQYTSLTGTSTMPQHFATAYHQCRWNYRDEEDVAEVDAKFDELDIPYDVLWLDIEHTDGKRYFTWDKVLFPNPVEMQNKLAAKGRHMVTIVDPHIKRDDGFPLHKEAARKGYYVKDAHGKDFDGWCWPGASSYLDMLNPEIRSWWAEKFSLSNYGGSTPSLYIWNDMNEPSVFNGPELTMPRDALHYGDVEHRDVHNAYGYYFHMASADGLLRRGGGNDRPFVLSRAFFAGTQRVGAVWTGDNAAEWEHLRVSVPMVLTLGLTGLAFSGADVGGFFGNPEPELLLRWYQLGAYYPFFRAHAHQDTKRREPWLFGDRMTELIREAIHIRYALLPYYYTLFREASVSGAPVMRPLWMEFPNDELTFSNDEAFLVGGSLLVQGIYNEGATSVTVYLPGSQYWYDLRTGAVYTGGEHYKLGVSDESIPAFQRGGTIIPRKDRFRRSSTQMAGDPYTLVIALNGSLEAEGELYVDDGRSYDYEKGIYIYRRFVFSNGRLTSTNLASDKSNKKTLFSNCIVERIIILGLQSKISSGGRTALVEPSNRRVDIEAGPLKLRPKSYPLAVIVRKPNVQIDEDWSIKIL
ncbi:probable glucan 1,3-alpha-glucosidase [Cryptomeria japonica]|uniref:probable glucan 1,3-alpha-glucosidase n=1 Tax=Cryptomeria japonica TaxID=3369 RepID=UPI0025AD7C14|nr:probable glucan 1,3-alpha-glucosidase [Cryptomeria japonica]